ncbi:hypothetical protein M0812_23795 [Anaeramoeba flamelloides]|uniref:Uncharacterized protein n=1 Tax=Anaeramoeba flamelloides TaxID=1746091 RepID=A0AAV7YF66_9EUKA|nr:hypothetical protein M0812_23795 [Anaeramoeba flamelloides]
MNKFKSLNNTPNKSQSSQWKNNKNRESKNVKQDQMRRLPRQEVKTFSRKRAYQNEIEERNKEQQITKVRSKVKPKHTTSSRTYHRSWTEKNKSKLEKKVTLLTLKSLRIKNNQGTREDYIKILEEEVCRLSLENIVKSAKVEALNEERIQAQGVVLDLRQENKGLHQRLKKGHKRIKILKSKISKIQKMKTNQQQKLKDDPQSVPKFQDNTTLQNFQKKKDFKTEKIKNDHSFMDFNLNQSVLDYNANPNTGANICSVKNNDYMLFEPLFDLSINLQFCKHQFVNPKLQQPPFCEPNLQPLFPTTENDLDDFLTNKELSLDNSLNTPDFIEEILKMDEMTPISQKKLDREQKILKDGFKKIPKNGFKKIRTKPKRITQQSNQKNLNEKLIDLSYTLQQQEHRQQQEQNSSQELSRKIMSQGFSDIKNNFAENMLKNTITKFEYETDKIQNLNSLLNKNQIDIEK